jgi:hypothetical protein
MENQQPNFQKFVASPDAKVDDSKPLVTGNQRMYQIMQKTTVPVRNTGN